jgi:hypothetical protein
MKFLFELFFYLRHSGIFGNCVTGKGQTTFTIDTIKTADFTIQREEVNTQRFTQSAAPNRSENDAIEQKGRHQKEFRIKYSGAKIMEEMK